MIHELEKISLKEKAYRFIKSEIVIGNYIPGLFLSEKELSKSMHMSRGPIREALNRLEKEGFVNIIPKRGTIVSHITTQEVNDIFKIRKLLESTAAKDSLNKISFIKLKEIKREFIRLMSKSENRKNRIIFFDMDKRFHKFLYIKCGNNKLIQILDIFGDSTNWFINIFFKDYSYKESIKDHLAIIEAIENKKEDLVVDKIIWHLERVRNSIISEIIS